MTQNTHRQETGLSMILRLSSKERMRVIKKKKTHNPPTMGPRTEPMKTLAVKRVVAGPRPTAGQISAMTPDDTLREKEYSKNKIFTARHRKRTSSKKTREKASYDQCFDIGRKRLSEDKQGIGRHGHHKDRSTTDQFAPWAPDQRLRKSSGNNSIKK